MGGKNAEAENHEKYKHERAFSMVAQASHFAGCTVKKIHTSN